jgi:hypothetical protein
MQSINVNYNVDTDTISPIETAKGEEWIDICDRFDNDVQRVKPIEHPDGYTALYLCFDTENEPFYYLVQEDARLKRLRHRVFFNKLGIADKA